MGKVKVFDMNDASSGWRHIASLNRANAHLNLVNHEGVIYAFSPKEKYYEYYNESLNTWTIVTSSEWPNLTNDAQFVMMASYMSLIGVIGLMIER